MILSFRLDESGLTLQSYFRLLLEVTMAYVSEFKMMYMNDPRIF